MPLKDSANRTTSKKLKNKKRIQTFLILLIPMAAVIGLLFSFVQFRAAAEKIQYDHFKKEFEIIAQSRLSETNNLINSMVDHLDYTADAISVYDNLWEPDVLELLEFSNSTSLFAFTAVADINGNGYDNNGNTFNVADREYFQTAAEGYVAFSEVMSSKLFDGEQVQVIAHPLRRENGSVRGVVFGVFHLSSMEKVDIPVRDEYIYIVDSCGKYIVKFQENELIISNGNFWSDLEQSSLTKEEIEKVKVEFEQREKGELSYELQGESRYACHMPIGPNKWQLVYSVSRSPADKLVLSLYQIDAKSSIIAGFSYIVLGLFAVGRFRRINNEVRQAHREAQRNLELMRMSIEHSKHIVFEYNQERKEMQLKTNINNRLFGHTVITSVPECFVAANTIAQESIPALRKLFETIENQESSVAEIQVNAPHKFQWYRVSMNNLYDENNEIVTTVGIAEDISALKEREAQIERKLQIQNTLIANALLYAKVNLKNNLLIELNGEELQIPFFEFLHNEISENVKSEQIPYIEHELSLEMLKQAYDQGRESVEVQYLRKSEQGYRWVSCIVYRIYMDDTSSVLFVITDIDQKKRRELALQRQAEHDGLTDLYNSATIRSKINEILAETYGTNRNHVLVLIDLDNFKQINDTFGHDYGDRVLIDVAEILNNRFRSGDIVGRLGGDEFIVLLRDMKSGIYADKLAAELCKAICKTYSDDKTQVTVSASVGIAMAPTDGNTFEELYKKADIAQYKIKKAGKNGYSRYLNENG